jgi:hypothetical protein
VSYNGGGGGIIHVSPVRRCFSLIIEIYLALQKTVKDSCRRQFVDYICPSEVLNGFRFIASFVSNSVLYLVLLVFLLGGGECYLVTIDFDSFSWRTCILMLLDE